MPGKINQRPVVDVLLAGSPITIVVSGHSAHVGQDVMVRYRWHPLYGQRVRRIQSERRASGELVHVEP